MANLSTKTGLPSFSQDQSSFINYFLDPGFERGVNNTLPAGWGQYNSTAALPGSGTGGAAVAQVTMLSSNSSPIRGTLSAVITKDAANRQGVGYSYPFTISQADKGVTAGVEIDIQTSANYVSGDMIFMIYDVTNSIAITPRNVPLPKLDNYGKFISDYGLTAGTSYRFILHIATVSALAYTVKIDTMVNTTTRVSVPGANLSNSVRYTPIVSTGTWGVVRGSYQRFAEWMELEIYSGPITANGSGIYTWSLDTGLTADIDALLATGIVPTLVDPPDSNQTLILVGYASINAQGATWYMDGTTGSIGMDARVYLASNNTIAVVCGSGLTPNRSDVMGSGNGLGGVLAQFQIRARIPITQWAGSGANFGPSSQLEYLSTPFTSYVPYRGSDGTLLSGTTPTGTSDAVNAGTAPWNNAQQPTDQLSIEVDMGGVGKWQDVGNSYIDHFRFDGTNYIGLGYYINPSNQLVIIRGKYATGVSTLWSSIPVGTRYRLGKANPTSPVGISKADANQGGYVAPRKGQVALTVTSTLIAWVTTRAIGIYYQDQDGNHRLKFTIRGTCTAGTSGNFLISGVTFKNITDWHQTVTIQAVGSAPYTGAGAATPGTNSVNCYGSSSSSEWRVSGDVELDSKPSWA